MGKEDAILAALVLALAGQLKVEKTAKGTSDFTEDAIRLIREKGPEILRAMR